MAIAPPRFSCTKTSAMLPAKIVIGHDPAIPARRRNANSAPMDDEGARAHARFQITNSTLHVWYTGIRPYISDRGAINRGPIA